MPSCGRPRSVIALKGEMAVTERLIPGQPGADHSAEDGSEPAPARQREMLTRRERPHRSRSRTRRRNLDSVLPRSGEGESAVAWGDGSDSNTERLLRDVPPHW